MNKLLLLFTLAPCLAFAQTTLIPEKFQKPVKELPGKHLSIENTTTAWVDTTVEYCLYNWDTLTATWVNDDKYTYTYDNNGNQLEQIWHYWDGSTWANDERFTYTYDINNNLIEYIGQYWDGSTWVSSYRYTYTYDSNSNQIEWINQNWDGSTWVNNWRYTSTYDSNGNQIEQIYQTWDGSAWVSSYRDTYTYDSNGNQIEQINQNWDGSSWVDSGRWTFTYDSNGNQIESIRQEWDGSNWVSLDRYTSTYDSNGNQMEYLYQEWAGSTWVNSWRDTYTYDSNGNPIEWIWQDWDGSSWMNDGRYALCDYVAAFGQKTYVPDDNFENYLESNSMGDGIANNDSVLTANISTVLALNVSLKSISDLTGIADFASLVSLDCFSNNLTSLDLSQGNSLEYLDCSGNFFLGSLDISGATNLYYLYCDFCQLSTLDVTNNIYLEELDIEVNQIQSIDISQNTNMLEYYCTLNQLTSIDVSHMDFLTVLQCNDNELTCLNVANGNNQNMTGFIAFNNPNLACIEVDDTTWANANWTVAGLNMDSTASFSDDCSSSCFLQPDCAFLEVSQVLIDDTSMTIDISIYNGDTIDINYPYIGLVVDAMGDTIQNGTASFFVQIALDTMTYSYALNSVSPVYPLTVYFAYSDLIGGMGTDTCVLSYTPPTGIAELPSPDKHLLFITDILGRTTLPTPNTLLFYIYDDGSVEKKIRLDR